mmetsp:Transcript_14991/g.26970  ORF Transcript_14991/g.26970 Transcript_14991/m.26970 type:complete len:205 (+) Transcript_14991:488-1102(+)
MRLPVRERVSSILGGIPRLRLSVVEQGHTTAPVGKIRLKIDVLFKGKVVEALRPHRRDQTRRVDCPMPHDDVGRKVHARAHRLVAAGVAAALGSLGMRMRRASVDIARGLAGANRPVAPSRHKYRLAAGRRYVADVYVVIDVVPNEIVGSIVLKLPGTLGSHRQVAFECKVAGAFVCVVAPAAIAVRLDVSAEVVVDDRLRNVA